MADQGKALAVGINFYQGPVQPLIRAVSDAEAVAERLERNADPDQTVNYAVEVLRGEGEPITRARLRRQYRALLDNFRGDVVFFFSGHGALEPTGACLVTSDGSPDDWGVPMQELIDLGIASSARSITLLLDCCHSGNAGTTAALGGADGIRMPVSVLRENMTVMAATLDTQLAVEAGEHGFFTAAVLDGLDGAAADILGQVTTSSLYAHLERRFSPWKQRPIAKSYITAPTVLRRCEPRLSLADLRQITTHFAEPAALFKMDPAHDPEVDAAGQYKEPQNARKMAIGALFKKYRDAGLLRPSTPGEQLWWTAQKRHTAELTLLGREYWALVKAGRI